LIGNIALLIRVVEIHLCVAPWLLFYSWWTLLLLLLKLLLLLLLVLMLLLAWGASWALLRC
jgi:hypothetical protein